MWIYCSLPPSIHYFLCSHFSIFITVSAVLSCSVAFWGWTFTRVAVDGLQQTAQRWEFQTLREGKLPVSSPCRWRKRAFSLKPLQGACTFAHHSNTDAQRWTRRASCYLRLPSGTLAMPRDCLVTDFIPQAENHSASKYRFEDLRCNSSQKQCLQSVFPEVLDISK